MAKVLYRIFSLDRAAADFEKRTVPLAFSSEYVVDRGMYEEVLDHSPTGMDMTFLRDGAPLLDSHNSRKQIGVVDSAEIGQDKVGRAIVRFSRAKEADEIMQDVKDGIRRHVSVGYEHIRELETTKLDGGRQRIRFAWRPFEISLVSVPADPTVGVGRESDLSTLSKTFTDTLSETLALHLRSQGVTNNMSTAAATTTPPNVEEITKTARTAEIKRFADIHAAAAEIGKQFPEAVAKFRELADKAVADGTSSADFNAELLKAIPGIRQVKTEPVLLGLSDAEKSRYSILRAIRSMLPEARDRSCFERDLSEAFAKKVGQQPEGILIPNDLGVDITRAKSYARDLNVTTGTQGGNFVATLLLTPIIEILRNRMVTERLGVQTLSGLSGNVAIPRQTGAATAFSLAEAGILTKSTQAINQLSLSPHRVGAYNSYTKQLLIQSSVDVENFIRDDLLKVLAIKLDKLILEGSGAASEPTGVLNTPAIGAVTFGAAATWAKVVAFETALSLANADMGRMAYVTTPNVRGKWKTISKVTNQASFLWEVALPSAFNGPAADYGVGTMNDGMVNGYRAACTNQISSDYVAFGNWEEAILGLFGGLDVVVDPYTSATSATVNIVVNSFIDVAVRHAASFAWSTDAGNQ